MGLRIGRLRAPMTTPRLRPNAKALVETQNRAFAALLTITRGSARLKRAASRFRGLKRTGGHHASGTARVGADDRRQGLLSPRSTPVSREDGSEEVLCLFIASLHRGSVYRSIQRRSMPSELVRTSIQSSFGSSSEHRTRCQASDSGSGSSSTGASSPSRVSPGSSR